MNKLLISGGAGFIGSNLAYHFSKMNYRIVIFDNFQRAGTRENIDWLTKQNQKIEIIEGDIRDYDAVETAVDGVNIIFHLAAQVAVTTSVTNPRTDFEINALGTFNLLEAARKSGCKPLIFYTSTNKVYGEMTEVEVAEEETRYTYQNLPYGISEQACLDFHSPYGCSKGAADQYVRDYCRIYDLPTVIFRQSCIYGPRQFGIEDQGWIAWFIIAVTVGRPITIYGDGKQVRDILFIDDLVELFKMGVKKIKIARGGVYNIGGGTSKTLSVGSEFIPILERLFRKKIKVSYADWRPGDQKIYVSDIRLVKKELGWEPKIEVDEGIERLFNWVQVNKSLFKNI